MANATANGRANISIHRIKYLKKKEIKSSSQYSSQLQSIQYIKPATRVDSTTSIIINEYHTVESNGEMAKWFFFVLLIFLWWIIPLQAIECNVRECLLFYSASLMAAVVYAFMVIFISLSNFAQQKNLFDEQTIAFRNTKNSTLAFSLGQCWCECFIGSFAIYSNKTQNWLKLKTSRWGSISMCHIYWTPCEFCTVKDNAFMNSRCDVDFSFGFIAAALLTHIPIRTCRI